MNIGDKVKFAGELDSFIKSFQPVLKRTGEIVGLPESGFYAGKVCVRWIPKTSRGRTEIFYHKRSELEVIV